VGPPRELRNSGFQSVPKFKNRNRVFREHPAEVFENRPIAIETVGAAIECRGWIVNTDLSVKVPDIVGRDIWRIGDDEVEWSPQRATPIATNQVRAFADAERSQIRTRD
jgi:hypothetical protein